MENGTRFCKVLGSHAASGVRYQSADKHCKVMSKNCVRKRSSFLRVLTVECVVNLPEGLIWNFSRQVAENLAQLMYSVMMTGYMFRNAQYRLELQTSLSQAALPVPSNGAVSASVTYTIQHV